ncbi:MAG: PIG-L family deacetylase [Opitutaceae bacterium]
MTRCPGPDEKATIFAPHQDDETLGCGGTILQKSALGTPVHLVFMTDGSTSHSRFISQDELRVLREKEALNAAGILGLHSRQVDFLRFPDGRLGHHHEDAVTEVRKRLLAHRPAEIFVPYRFDGTTDHEATYAIVTEALCDIDYGVTLFEYPIWFWNQWPWVSLPLRLSRELPKEVARSMRFGLGLTSFRHFSTGTDISKHLEGKRAALAAHRSQMERLQNEPNWPILSDVSNGQFLECLLDDCEVFRVTHIPAHSDPA